MMANSDDQEKVLQEFLAQGVNVHVFALQALQLVQ